MVTPLALPQPPESIVSNQDKIATFKQMLVSLEETAKYQEEAIAYHQQSLELLQQEAKNTKAQLEFCRNTIDTLTKTQQLIPTVTPEPQEDNTNGHQTVKPQDKAKTKTPAKPPTKSKSSKTKPKSPTKPKAKTSKPSKSGDKKSQSQAVQKSKSSKAQSKTSSKTSSKPQTKVSNKLPPSPVLDRFESITAMVLDYMQRQEGVVETGEIINYCYPDGLSEPQRKKVYSSFSSVLITGMKKGVFERTVPGKYRWVKTKKK